MEMKKKLVCILGSFYPFFTPNSRIAYNVLCELKDEYDITIIAQNTRFSTDKEAAFNEMKIISVNDFNHIFHNLFMDKVKSSVGLKKQFFKALLLAKRCVNYMIRLTRTQSVSRTYIRKVKQVLEKINKEEGIDILMPVSEPHESVFAAVEFQEKHRNVILIPYKLDRFAEGNSLYENKLKRLIKYPRHQKTEIKTLSACDALFALPPIAEYYAGSDLFFGLRDKVIKTEHPLLKRPEICVIDSHNDETVNVTYAGSLDMKLRNPEYMLRLFSKVFEKTAEMKLNLYSFGNCQSIIDNFKSKLGDSLNDAGKVPSNVVPIKLNASDILITIGNNSDDEVPSKLFEYLAYGKPIVHFYYSDKDAYIKYLGNYPCSLLIKMDESLFDENLSKLRDFCRNNSKVRIPYEEIESKFVECTPKYVADQFRSLLKKYESFSHSVIVAHPNQQHSMKLATALKRVGILHTYITTVYYPRESFKVKMARKFLGESFVRKMLKKGDVALDGSSKIFCNLLALICYAFMRCSYNLSCKVYVCLTKRFGVKVAKYAIASRAKAVVMYDYTAVSCFEYLKKYAPEIKRILDMSSIPAKKIDKIISHEEEIGYGVYFKNKRMRYTKEYCEYFAKELELAQAYLSPSDYIDRSLIECGAEKNHIFRAMYGVDLDAFVYSPKNPQSNDKIEFVFTGRVEGPKGIFYLLNAFDNVYETRKDFNLHIVGPNCIEKDFAKERKYVVYHGLVNRDQLIEIYKDMHVFVLPSLWEGLSLSSFEAMSSGLCQIVSDATGSDSVVIENNSGLVVKAQDEKSLEDAVLTLLNNKDVIAKYSVNARNSVTNRSWEQYYDDAGKAVMDILSNSQGNV